MFNYRTFKITKVESGKWKCPHILHVKPTIRGFILPLDSFSNLLPSSYMVLSKHPSHHIRCA